MLYIFGFGLLISQTHTHKKKKIERKGCGHESAYSGLCASIPDLVANYLGFGRTAVCILNGHLFWEVQVLNIVASFLCLK